jgi:hypothetical protein
MIVPIKDALLDFCHKNNINVVELIKELDRLDHNLANLEQEPDYLKKRVVNMLFDGLFSEYFAPKAVKAKKAELFNAIFGKDEAVKLLFQEQYMKGMPPVRFLEEFFGKELHAGLMDILKKKYNLADIRRFDDFDQIAFVKQIIDNDIGVSFPWWKKHLPIKFAQFMKEGYKRDLVFPTQMEEEEKLRHVKEMKSFLEQQGLKVTKSALLHLLEQAFDDQDTINKHLDILFNESGPKYTSLHSERKSVSGTEIVEQVDAKIIDVLSEYFNSRTSSLLFQQAMGEAGVTFLDKADVKKRNDFLNCLVNNPQIAALSLQRRTIISSWIRTWLNI